MEIKHKMASKVTKPVKPSILKRTSGSKGNASLKKGVCCGKTK